MDTIGPFFPVLPFFKQKFQEYRTVVGGLVRIDGTESRQVSCFFPLLDSNYGKKFEQEILHELSCGRIFLSKSIHKDQLNFIGERDNEYLHPRDTNDGQLMLKMVLMQSINRVLSDSILTSDERRVIIELLPIRCFMHQ